MIGYINGIPVVETRAIVHDPSNGQFTSGGGSSIGAGKTHKDDHLFSKIGLKLTHADLTKAFSVNGLEAKHQKTIALPGGKGARAMFTLHDADGKKTGEVNRSFHIETYSGKDMAVAHHDYLKLDKSHQGKGTAKAILKNSVELYKKHDISVIKLEAGLDKGRYVWAHMGFRAPPHEVELYKQALIAEHSHHLKKELKDKSSTHIPATPEQIAHIQGFKSMQQIAEYKTKDSSGKELAVGKTFLLNSGGHMPQWHGLMHLKDGSPSYEHFKKKIGI